MNAVYVRQSVDKRDSISIESQIDACLREIGNHSYRIYADKGFSGKNTNRPQFKKLMEDITSGEISCVYVYKIDRISRAILDFGKIMEIFEKYGIEFISHTEKFDTSTPMGKAMLSIIMVFAQLERETIQQRITDNYYSRGEKGFYLGGYAPFGYTKTELIKEGKRTACYKKSEKEAGIVCEIYTAYGSMGKSMNTIACDLNKKKIPTRRNGKWSQSGVSRILGSPVYVRADAEVYQYLKSLGAHMNNHISDYKGVNGCYIYGNAQKRRNSCGYENDYITLGEHEGIISSDLWLEVQKRRTGRQNHSNSGTGTLSWLQGLVKCRSCGYSCYVKKYKGGQKYFYCRGKRNAVCCASRKMMKCGELEEFAEQVIKERIKLLNGIEISDEVKPEVNKLKMKISETDEKIKKIMKFACEADEVSAIYINDELNRLHHIKTETEKQLEVMCSDGNNRFDSERIIHLFDEGSIEIKKRIAVVIACRIEIDGKDADIYLN